MQDRPTPSRPRSRRDRARRVRQQQRQRVELRVVPPLAEPVATLRMPVPGSPTYREDCRAMIEQGRREAARHLQLADEHARLAEGHARRSADHATVARDLSGFAAELEVLT